jgi:hypothetical protein
MSKTLAIFLIVGIPFALSLAWCLYWVIRVVRFRRQKAAEAAGKVTSRPRGGGARR